MHIDPFVAFLGYKFRTNQKIAQFRAVPHSPLPRALSHVEFGIAE